MNTLTLLKTDNSIQIKQRYAQIVKKNFVLQYALSDLSCFQSEDHKVSVFKQDKTNEYPSCTYGIDDNTIYNIIV